MSDSGEQIASRSGNDSRTKEYTRLVNEARTKIECFIGIDPKDDVVLYTLNTSDAIGKLSLLCNFNETDLILIPRMEHTSNFLPWLLKSGATIIRIDQNLDGSINLQDLEEKLQLHHGNVRIVAFSGASNLTGTRPRIQELVKIIKLSDSKTLVAVDCAQYAPHFPMNKKDWGADFIYFSGHKLGAPNAPGVLAVPSEWLQEKIPLIPGGGTVADILIEDDELKPIWASEEAKYQPGTWPTLGIIELAGAIETLNSLGWEEIVNREHELLVYAFKKFLLEIQGFRPLPVPSQSYEKMYLTPVLSFNLDGYTADELSTHLAENDIQHRGGSNDPICNHEYVRNVLNLNGIVRLSFCYHNTPEEIDRIGNLLARLRLERPLTHNDDVLKIILGQDTKKLEELYIQRGKDNEVEELCSRNLTHLEKDLKENLALRELYCRFRDDFSFGELSQLNRRLEQIKNLSEKPATWRMYLTGLIACVMASRGSEGSY
ncbi:aminotransferase class V-fold PLP-dependent enzyme [Candidatus Micrarchaeota archaeon]|nr:aminotransferase class V-fold PLP-dependent enzyme [Candidatus Micrarchaeota archaeon]